MGPLWAQTTSPGVGFVWVAVCAPKSKPFTRPTWQVQCSLHVHKSRPTRHLVIATLPSYKTIWQYDACGGAESSIVLFDKGICYKLVMVDYTMLYWIWMMNTERIIGFMCWFEFEISILYIIIWYGCVLYFQRPMNCELTHTS